MLLGGVKIARSHVFPARAVDLNVAPSVACLFVWFFACQFGHLHRWLHRSLACFLACLRVKIGARAVVLSTWLHRALACLHAYLHVKFVISIGGSIGPLRVCWLACV